MAAFIKLAMGQLPQYCYTFEESQIKAALQANGWREAWADGNWVHKSDCTPDWSGRSLADAWHQLLRSKNLI